MKPAVFAALFMLAVVSAALGQGSWPTTRPGPAVHPYDEPQPPSAPEELMVVVEIPAGSAVKYEIDKVTGRVFVDRFQSMPVTAPANYGSIPRTLAPDGDPVDAVILARFPLHPGVFLKVRPVGVIKTVDGAHIDEKILVVPVSAVDPTYNGITDIGGIPPMERERIAAYFRVYKQLPRGQEGKILEFGDASAARKVIVAGIDRYREARK